ncbi:hypothetical protein [Clostridium sp. DL1XJH146]
MNSNVSEILKRCEIISENLDSQKLIKVTKSTKEILNVKDKLRVTFISQPFNGLLKLLLNLLESPSMFPESINRVNKSYFIKVSFAEEITFKKVNEDGESEKITKDDFEKNLLDEMEINEDKVFRGEILINAPFLNHLDLNFICSKNEFKDVDWYYRFASTDIAFLLLSSIRLLSISEKQFLKGDLAKILSFRRLGIIVNNMDLLEQENRVEVLEYIQRYFSKYEEKIPTYYYSSNEVTLAQINNETINDENMRLIDFIKNELSLKTETLRKISEKQVCTVYIKELESVVNNFKEKLNLDKQKIDKAISQIKGKSEQLDFKKESTKRRINMYINGVVKIEFLDKIDKFNGKIKEDLEQTIMESEDMDEMKTKIPLFIEEVWGTFYDKQKLWLEKTILSELNDVYKNIQTDVIEIASDLEEDVEELIFSCLQDKFHLDSITNTKIKADNKQAVLSKYLSIGGVALLFVNFPMGVLSIGTGQILRVFYKDSIESDKRKKLCALVLENCDKFKTEIDMKVEGEFSKITENLQDEADKIYDRLVALLIDTLEEQKLVIKKSEDKADYLRSIENKDIPELLNLVDLF